MKSFGRLSRFVPSDTPVWSLWFMAGAVAIGAGLRVYQFGIQSSLWLDELAMANNIAERSWSSLLREPLAYAQVAPLGFVAFEKAMFDAFGRNDLALRLYSLLAGIGSLGAIALVALRAGFRELAWVAPLLLGLGGPFIFQSAQVKPYAGDVFFSLVLLAIALRLVSVRESSRLRPMALGMLAPWFSFAASFTLAGIGLVLLLSAQRRRYLVVSAVWGLSVVAALAYATLLVDRTTLDAMQIFWSRDGVGFPTGVGDVIPWALVQFRAHLWSELGLRGVTYWLGIAGLGAIALWWRNRFALALIAAPILVALIAAAARRYPLGGRLSHWIAAFLVLFVVAAVAEAGRFLRRMRLGELVPLAGTAVAVLPLLSLLQNAPPYRVENVKPVLAEIARRREEGDWLYVHSGAWHAYRYYGHLSGIPAHRIVPSLCPRESAGESLAPFDAVRGRSRVWVLFTHVNVARERELVLSYLDRIGERRFSLGTPKPFVRASWSVETHLYDLSDRAKRQRATWNTFPISASEMPNEPTICTVGMVPRRTQLPRIERAGEVEREPRAAERARRQ